MIRVFGHHIALPVMLVAGLDVCLFFLGLVLALWLYPTIAYTGFTPGVIDTPLLLGLMAINLGCLVAAGFYNRDALLLSTRLSKHLGTALALIAVAYAVYLLAYSLAYGHRFSNLYALTLAAAFFQLIMLVFLRAFFFNVFDVVGLKRRILLLGNDAFSAKLQSWLTVHDSRYTEVIPYDAVVSERVVPLRRGASAVALATNPLLSWASAASRQPISYR